MENLSNLFWVITYILSVFGLLVLLAFGFIGGTMVYHSFKFAVTLAFAEFRHKKLKQASIEAQKEFQPKNTDTDNDNDTQAETTKATGSTKPKR